MNRETDAATTASGTPALSESAPSASTPSASSPRTPVEPATASASPTLTESERIIAEMRLVQPGVLIEADARFDVRAFARNAAGSMRDSIDVTAFAANPLPDAVLGALRLLRDAERGTMSQLRNMLVTPTHKDARVTSFLSAWAYEKFWIADALDAVVAAHPDAVDVRTGSRGVARLWKGLRERLRPITNSISGNLRGADTVALHVALGAVDEWVTGLWYDRIDAIAQHPELSAVLERVREVKTRHIAFFESEARARLETSARARRLVASKLKSVHFPVPGPFESHREMVQTARYLLAGAAERLAETAARIASLPGLARVAAHAVAVP